MKVPPKRLSNFQLLTHLMESQDSFYPLNFFQQKYEHRRSFLEAFLLGADFFTVKDDPAIAVVDLKFKPGLHFSKKILGHRLQSALMSIRTKLSKIKQIMRVLAHKET